MKAVILTTLLIISYATASPLLEDENQEELSRTKRAARAPSHWKVNEPKKLGSKPIQVCPKVPDDTMGTCAMVVGCTSDEGCPTGEMCCSNGCGQTCTPAVTYGKFQCSAGKKAKVEYDEKDNLVSLQCIPCPEGEYTKKPGLYIDCIACPDGEKAPEGSDKCAAGCDVGKGWNEQKRCVKCAAGTFNDVQGGFECKPCRKFHKSKNGAEQCELNCPLGFEPSVTEDGPSCRACRFGSYNGKADRRKNIEQCVSCCGEATECVKNWTLTTGADSKKQCIKLRPTDKECFTGLVKALKHIREHMNKEDSEDQRIHKAFCRSGLKLADLKTLYDQCNERTVTMNEVEEKLHPKLKTDDEMFLGLDSLFGPGEMSSCEVDDSKPGDHTPPPEGGDRTTPPPKRDDTNPPPAEGGDRTTPPPKRDGTKPPPSEGGDRTTPPPKRDGTKPPPPEGGDRTTPPPKRDGTNPPPSEGDGRDPPPAKK